MFSQYYYLVAGLPDLLLDEMKTPPSFGEAMEEIESWVSPSDAALVRTMRLPYDNYNLITVLESKNRPFDTRGGYTLDQLTQEVKTPDLLPDYMRTLVTAFREGRQVFAGRILEDQLNWLFYDEMAEHCNEFIREWYCFERDLRNVLAVAAVRAAPSHLLGPAPVSASAVVLGNTEAGDRMAKSTAPDLGVGQVLPWAERVLGFARANLVEFEKSVDRLRWGMLDDLTTLSGFGVETLCAFAVKLAMVHRWQRLDAAFGKERLETLSAELQAGYRAEGAAAEPVRGRSLNATA